MMLACIIVVLSSGPDEDFRPPGGLVDVLCWTVTLISARMCPGPPSVVRAEGQARPVNVVGLPGLDEPLALLLVEEARECRPVALGGKDGCMYTRSRRRNLWAQSATWDSKSAPVSLRMSPPTLALPEGADVSLDSFQTGGDLKQFLGEDAAPEGGPESVGRRPP